MKNRIHQKPAWFHVTLVLLFITPLFFTGTVSGFNLTVTDTNGNPVNSYRWLVEEDTTSPVTPGVFNPNSLGVSIHKSYAPVVSSGHATSSTIAISLPFNQRYVVSVLPDGGYAIGGTNVAAGQLNVTAKVITHPIPTAQISVQAFHDNAPVNGVPDAGTEEGLANFTVIVYDQMGQMSTDAFGNNLGTTYLMNPDGTFQLDANGSPIMDVMGNGILTDSNGFAYIKNLAPGKYGTRILPGDDQPWVQTNTIEGTPGVDSWVQPDEPPYFTEFGLYTPHVFIGFVQPTNDFPAGGSGAITGQFVNVHQSRPPSLLAATGLPVEEAWVGINSNPLAANSVMIYAQPCNPDGTFTIPNVPPGTYQIVMWDKPLDSIMNFSTVIVPAEGGVVDAGPIPVNRWFGTFEGSVFYDMNENGFRDAGEDGIPSQVVNLRFRDGTIYQSTITDVNGNYGFAEVFPFFKWIVAEVDYTRFKPTGATIVVDDGGIMPFGAKNNPQPQPENGFRGWRTETGPFPVLLEGMTLYADQTNTIDWGKVTYPEGENGGIAGIIFYATTRAEDDARFANGEPWEPGIPRVQVNLYADSDNNGIIDDLNHNGQVTLADVDNYPFANFPGPEDIDRNGNGIFNAGDALNIAWSDSWDDNFPTDCVGLPQDVNGVPIMDCAETLRTWNQIRPAVFDGGYAFTSYFPGGMESGSSETEGLPSGIYIVEAAPPTGYLLVKEEDKNVVFGDQYTPSLQAYPPACVGNTHVVPAELTLFPGEPCPTAGQTRPLCDKKQVTVVTGKNAPADFHLFTEVPKAGRFVGIITNDLFNTPGANNPNFAEKLSPSWVPISLKDFQGNEITRIYSDDYGKYNVLLPSTFTINPPIPTGVSPNMVSICLNDPGPIPDPRHPLRFITDPFYNPAYSQVCLAFDVWPAKTTYVDTPLLPIGAFTGSTSSTLDCESPDMTPVIYSVSGPTGGPYVATAGQVITIESLGEIDVPNPDYDPNVPGSPPTITRDYGFGSVQGSVTVSGTPLTNLNWASDGLTISGTVPLGTTTGQLMVTRGDNGVSTIVGVTLHVGDGPVVRVNNPLQSIQAAIDSAAPNSVILVGPGTYKQNLIMWKPLSLQGWGETSTIIDASFFTPAKRDAAIAFINNLVTSGAITLVPGQRPDLFLEQGAGITVLADQTSFGPSPNARIDGFTIKGATNGGGIFVNGYAHYLEISNNRLQSNEGGYGGGIRIGWPTIVNATSDGYVSSLNDNINVHNNHIVGNGSTGGGGAVTLFNGTNNYAVTDNYLCGNFSALHGAGIAHVGLSNPGLIARDKIILNQTYNGGVVLGNTVNGYGGGIFIGGEPVPPAATSSPGTGSVTVNANLIQGNQAVSDGGGISVIAANGQDVEASPGNAANWYAINIFNNLIVNNFSEVAGGGISLTDAANCSIINTTISDNDSTATSINAFPAGNITLSNPQAAGLIAREHSPALVTASGQAFSNPVLYNNILWHNRSFYYDASQNAGLGGLMPNPIAPYWDLQVYTPAANFFAPQNCILTDSTGYDLSNSAADPLFVSPYFNVYQNAANAGEGGNFVTVIFSPLKPAGNYHIGALSPAIDLGTDIFLTTFPLLQQDYDGQTRPNGGVDSGADERY